MKIAIVSDTQGNLPAFKVVMKHIESQEVDIKVHLGNIVGACPYPDDCIELAIKEFNYILRSRQDDAMVDIENALAFNPIEKEAAEWTNNNAKASSKEMIDNLEYVQSKGEILFVNNSPSHIRKTIQSENDAELSFSKPIKPFEIAFVGQTGVPNIWTKSEQEEIGYYRPRYSSGLIGEASFDLQNDNKYIINVGSVGTPKDGDARASYAIYNTQTRKLTLFRVPYGIDKTVGKMQQRGFSTNSYLRLLHGK